jgi:hypothetical protein
MEMIASLGAGRGAADTKVSVRSMAGSTDMDWRVNSWLGLRVVDVWRAAGFVDGGSL